MSRRGQANIARREKFCDTCQVVNPQRNPLSVALGRSRAALLCVGLYSGAINVLTLTGSLFMLQVYDRVLPSRSPQTLAALLAIVAFLFGIQAILEAIRARMFARVGRQVDEELSRPAFRSAVSLPVVLEMDMNVSIPFATWITSASSSLRPARLPCSICLGRLSTCSSVSCSIPGSAG